MQRSNLFPIAVMLTMLGALCAAPALAQDAAAPAAPAVGGVKGDMLTSIKEAEGELIELAEAMPEAKYAWRPNKEVRSVGEVFMHVAAGNFGIPNFWGVKPPEGFNFATHEGSLTKKADIQKSLKDSFAHMEKALMDTPDADLDKPAEYFGIKGTVRSGYLLLLAHAHEHLGQSIAYARMIGVVPPWTARTQAAMKAAQEKKASGTK